MANKHTSLTSLFGDIAAAIRNKTGQTGTLVADDFPSAIAAINAADGSFWIECGTIKTESTCQHLHVEIMPDNPDNYSRLLGCCIWFTSEAGSPISDSKCVIFATSPSQGFGEPKAYASIEGTVSIDETTWKITWEDTSIEYGSSTALAHYIVYGFK